MALHIYFNIKYVGDENIAAFGYAHKTNFLKFRILEALVNSEEPLTTRDIEKITGVQYTTISAAMSRYQKIHKKSGATIKLPYIQRLAKKGPNGLYRYKITKKGIEAYFQYLQRIRRGFSLKRVGKPQRMETYGKFPCGPIRIEEDMKLLPEQLMPYYSMTQMGKAFDEEHGLDKETHILRIENRIRQLSSESKSA
ncbi:MarR family transcriptional regulator [Methanosarcina mazei]|uniref:Uncharacterized protein n=1 Tax=Methanosarcina mazei TaxID=2209 RepID=A0A0F8HZH3_METMZ|nr:MarR family transcriptional regulator [Methanosarcina mazei]KKG83057.1 hypothetical protein DU55_08130 [Methanosarcina mazei]